MVVASPIQLRICIGSAIHTAQRRPGGGRQHASNTRGEAPDPSPPDLLVCRLPDPSSVSICLAAACCSVIPRFQFHGAEIFCPFFLGCRILLCSR